MTEVKTIEEQDKELEEKIKSSSGYNLWRFTCQTVLKNIGSINKDTPNKFAKMCMARVKELTRDRFGSWEQAKMEVNHMPVPMGITKTQDLLPTFGYPTQYVVGKTKAYIVLINGKTNECHIRPTDQNFSTQEAEDIFNS